jgi:hypothetical protein
MAVIWPAVAAVGPSAASSEQQTTFGLLEYSHRGGSTTEQDKPPDPVSNIDGMSTVEFS